MKILDDRNIRDALITRLSTLARAPKAILEELRVHNGNAIADVVTVHTYPHCYEIKGDNDSVNRALKQAQYYDLVFNKITLVTTDKQIEKALLLVPPHWGIMRAYMSEGIIKLSYVRPARHSPDFDKKSALLTLWKSELIDIALPIGNRRLEKLNRAQLSELIAVSHDINALSKRIGDKLIIRHT